MDSTRLFHTTIQDILDLPIGSLTIFQCLDESTWDASLDTRVNRPGTIMRIDKFLRNGHRLVFRRTAQLVGTAYMMPGDHKSPKRWEFDIEYKPGVWNQLQNGYVSCDESDQSVFKFSEPLGKHWTKFCRATRVGWRGPMVKIGDISKMPKIIWTNNFASDVSKTD
jgi:hypothetical protein